MKATLNSRKENTMEIGTMGKVLVAATIENLNDLAEVDLGYRKSEEVRRLEISEALVDTGAMFLSLPRRHIQQLGLKRFRTRKAHTSSGIAEFGMYRAVKLTVQGRDCLVEVAELPDECPVLIGQIPLEALDFVVDSIGQRLLGNPAHGGEHMMDLL
jgi:predicted aspartyl protease